MKITMYELLGMVKDGKAPKKIKVTGNIYDFDEEFGFYFTKSENGEVALGGVKNDINLLFNSLNNNNVEILEEEKKMPEKLDVLVEVMSSDKIGVLTNEIGEIQRRFNQLLDYLNSKGE